LGLWAAPWVIRVSRMSLFILFTSIFLKRYTLYLLIYYNCEIFSVDFCDFWGDENCAQLCLGVPRPLQRFPDDVCSRPQPPYCFGDFLA
jgi:hypothetical protein